jgi:hypothetical protein
MNPALHAEISVKKRGGVLEDYYPIHAFMDCTKDLCSDNRHRILHTMWGIQQVVVPIFGHTIVNADGKKVNVKDMCEQDHILPDYQNRFIPTLADFVAAIDDAVMTPAIQKNIETCFALYKNDAAIADILLSPLALTGSLKSLLLTHNSWFLNFILPKISKKPLEIRDFGLSPSVFYNAMTFDLWMDNGSAYPKSAEKLNHI